MYRHFASTGSKQLVFISIRKINTRPTVTGHCHKSKVYRISSLHRTVSDFYQSTKNGNSCTLPVAWCCGLPNRFC